MKLWIFTGQKPLHTSAVSNLVFVAALILIAWVGIWILVQNQHEQLWLQEEPDDVCSLMPPLYFLSILLFFTFSFLYALKIHVLDTLKSNYPLILKIIIKF